MSYSDAIGYLYGLQKHGIKLGLDKTERILSVIGDPHRRLRAVHVAGTNGKGSTAAMTASILRAYGFKVGLFTSPHLVSFTERMTIDGRKISEAEVVELTGEIRSALRHAPAPLPDPTFFEFVTAMAFLHFTRNSVDWAVMEVGMGGRLDATNVLTPAVSVITKIGMDHKEFLGTTLVEIAREKAGIIKPGIPVVAAPQEPEAEAVIAGAARHASAPLFTCGRDFSGALRSSSLTGTTFDYRESLCGIAGLHTPLAGEHQLVNACLAVKASMIALLETGHAPCPLTLDPLKKGLAATEWRGRLEWIEGAPPILPPILIDGAHNADAARALARFIQGALSDREIVLVMGVMADKDIPALLTPLLPLAAEIVFTAPDYGRAAAPSQLAAYALELGYASATAPSVREAIELAKRSAAARKSGLVLITGSFYTIGEAKEALGETAVLGTLRESL